MAISLTFAGAQVFKPGYYGDPKAPWYNNAYRKPLLLLLVKLRVKSAFHYSFYP